MFFKASEMLTDYIFTIVGEYGRDIICNMLNSEIINYTELKGKAELSIEKAKAVILQNIPKEEIIAIYVKGSYAQGELRPDSDVDVVVILKTEEYLPKVYTLDAEVNYLLELT